MDNSQFRDLLQSDRRATKAGAAASPPGFKKPALGSRARASIPMTPRSVAGYNASSDFARQVQERKREQEGQPPLKKFKSTAAPKGTKLGAGYQDRTRARLSQESGESAQDDKEKRLKALEEMYKLQQIDEETFESLKNEIGVGGDIGSTHLVKGLDWKLLGRIRRGEDIATTPSQAPKIDVDDELDQVLEKEVRPRSQSPTENQGEPSEKERQPLTRDEILRRLKEGRTETKEQAAPAVELGGHFKKVNSDSNKSSKKKIVEVVNGRRREVLIITRKDGTTKRKSRWIDDEDATGKQDQPWGMEVPAELLAKQQALLSQQTEEEEDDDIFQGAGEYNPLAAIDSGSEDSGGETTKEPTSTARKADTTGDKPRNYFQRGNQAEEVEDRRNPILQDPTIVAALKRAAGLRRGDDADGDEGVDSDPDRASKQKQLLAQLKERDRADAADLDMGFGESRFGDDDDEEHNAVWDQGDGAGKKTARKRGPKKHRGDKDSVGDVMAAMEGRRQPA